LLKRTATKCSLENEEIFAPFHFSPFEKRVFFGEPTIRRQMQTAKERKGGKNFICAGNGRGRYLSSLAE